MNPVTFDSRRARNGGLILDGGDVYRIYQVQGFDMYGAGMGVARVMELSEAVYQEEVFCEIPARSMRNIRNIKGCHTFSFDSGVLLWDFVKYDYYRAPPVFFGKRVVGQWLVHGVTLTPMGYPI
jgi:hypothetical protein